MNRSKTIDELCYVSRAFGSEMRTLRNLKAEGFLSPDEKLRIAEIVLELEAARTSLEKMANAVENREERSET